MSYSPDTEKTTLMSQAPSADTGEQTKRKKVPPPDWGKFGLNPDQDKPPLKVNVDTGGETGFMHTNVENKNELFQEDKNLTRVAWWKANFFIRAPVLFGTWDGVFTSVMMNLLGVVIFLRMGWMIGNAGLSLTIVIIILSMLVVLIVTLSGIGVCERCKVQSGGVYFLISHVLGARIGGCVGLVYCFAQAVSCSLSVMGFGESVMALIGTDNKWIAKGIAILVVILLLGINIAGVKWVIRLQLVLLFLLFLSVMDFLVGSFVHTDSEHGVTGYSLLNLRNNSGPDYLPGENFLSIFGLFFSTVTGILAGINMSGDLREPCHNIPTGTMSALGVSTFLYLSIALVLGATCNRLELQTDYMISEKVSVAGFLWLSGLYISSVSSCMGSLYGPPRILQTIADENVIPIIRVLGHGYGPNKVPIFALVLLTLVSLLFVLVGDVNTLAPIVTTAFMMSYTAINYSYFALAMSYDKQQARELRYGNDQKASKKHADVLQGYGSIGKTESTYRDSFQNIGMDLDKLFPERLTHQGQRHIVPHDESGLSVDADFDATQRSKSMDNISQVSNASQVLLENKGDQKQPVNMEITKQPRTWYSLFCNRWLSLFGTVVCIAIMFGTKWTYSLGEVLFAIIIYIYVGQAAPGYFPGITEFNMYEWIKGGIQRCIRGNSTKEEIVIAASTPAVTMLAAQLTEENEDFASRERYHQSEVVQGDNFDSYEDDSEN